MSSLEVLQHQNGGLESLDSEYSIIADQPLVNGVSDNDTTNGHFDLHLALTSATPDLSLEELQIRLADVVEDNVSLREALRKNNDMMHQHLSSTQSWHNQLTTTMSKQQLDLKEAQDRIKELEKELQEKTKELEEKKYRAVRDNISPLSDEEVDFEIINRKELKKMVDESKLKEAEDKISNLIKVIEDQNKEMETLKKKSTENEVSQAIFKESFQGQEASRSNASIQQLENKVKELEQTLAVESANLEEEKACHLETKKMFAMVQTNYDRVTKLLQIQSRDEKDKTANDIEREMDTKMYLEQIDELTAKLMDSEQKLLQEEERVKALTSELNALKEDSETIPILKAQAEVYKLDLETTTLARDAAKEEVNRLAQQLQDAGSVSYCDSWTKNTPAKKLDFGHGSMMEGASKGKKKLFTHKKLELKQKDELFCCPVCLKGFTSLRAVESHANDCIDQSEKSSH